MAWFDGMLSLKGNSWPPIARWKSAPLVALLHYLEESQWFKREEIEAGQLSQLATLVAYAAQYSPHLRGRLQKAGLQSSALTSMEALQQLPVMTRRDVQTAGKDLFCTQVPPSHLPSDAVSTSGSTGEPLTVHKTAVQSLFLAALTMREHFWHRHPLHERITVIRAHADHPQHFDSWSTPVDMLFESGEMQVLPVSMSVAEQMEHLRSFKPAVLLLYPGALRAILDWCRTKGEELEGLQHIWTISEMLSPSLRQQAETFFGVPIHNNYSSQEFGAIALECPVSHAFHVMAESLLVEVLDEQGRPCREGEIGRLVITDLHNLATPLIRYAIGDYAEVGGTCPCGRGLPVLKRIMGRERNLMALPNGQRHWPHIGVESFHEIAPVLQGQFIQHDLQNMEVRLVTARPLTPAEEQALRAHVCKSLAHPFEIRLTYFEERIPLSASGKFEEFICLV